ncbi:MAG TPA: prolyl oligopeptidase family serine peptidase [Actinophytocola sp.]|uniref:prolyl oligopeptidase family serine peptidase n=1 Tax=Actinophytocola sp. TaxID=1872138 RepID=UPI002DBBDADC|nr:prolyl oligopeptidase family serine peptidase [Actinophytocola sp.]HEU5474688.1 prolyl oligopeptidase family serine peptidase [Actinophytocola sp.]
MVEIAPYGTWTSPVSAERAAGAQRTPGWVGLHAGAVWWTESRPEEGGRVALLRAAPGEPPAEVLAAPWNVRNRVHEYGGRPFTGVDGGIAFTNWADQRVYLSGPDGGDPVPLSPEPERPQGIRYADLTAGPGGEHVWAVRETVTGDAPTDVRRDLVALPVTGAAAGDPAAVRVLTATHHFMTGPKVSPDGRLAAWIGWDHPRMPWDGTELCVAEIQPDGSFGLHRVLTGGPSESVCQVEWDGPDAVLALTDPDGWWNLYRITLDGRRTNLAPGKEELGGPLWMLGMRWFAPLGAGRHAVLRSGRLAVLDERSATVTDVESDVPVWMPSLATADGVVVSTAGGPTRGTAVVRLNLSSGELTPLTEPPPNLPDQSYLPVPTERWFTDHNGHSIPALVYPPRNPEFAAPDGEAPPFLVHVHGGPTSKFIPLLSLEIAYFTSRGLGVVAVNYGGSTGYGREFRELLNEQWGVVDVGDCATVATALAKEGIADEDRLVVRGGSAGGWTAAASITSVDTYRCATAMFPIIDLAAWTSAGGETHDFESRYVEGLVGTLPEHTARYIERSPINHVDRVAGPVLVLQGLEDPVCPPEQAKRFAASLDGTGIPHACLLFEGEQHGFRRAESIVVALHAELSFYGQVFGFEPPGIPAVELRR